MLCEDTASSAAIQARSLDSAQESITEQIRHFPLAQIVVIVHDDGAGISASRRAAPAAIGFRVCTGFRVGTGFRVCTRLTPQRAKREHSQDSPVCRGDHLVLRKRVEGRGDTELPSILVDAVDPACD